MPCLTAIETAIAAAEALDPAIADQVADVRSIQEWLTLIGERHELGGSAAEPLVSVAAGA